jgi:transcriptional regulator with XRE-family HTH domain
MLRRRRGFRQGDIALKAKVSQSLVSLVERGHIGSVSVDRIRALFAVVDAEFDGTVRWRGGEADRLLDERHAQLVGAIASLLRRHRAEVVVEVTFDHFGDRGSIDLLAGWSSVGAVLVVEVKSVVMSADETVRRLDIKARLGSQIARERLGWSPRTTARLLVVGDTGANRRRIDRHARVLDVAFPDRGWVVRRWLRAPTGPLSGLLFLPFSNPETRRARNRAN